MTELVAGLRTGNMRALARAISLVERRDPAASSLLADLDYQQAEPAVVGITGAPGSGKSTLVDGLVGLLRQWGHGVAVIAVDPNSPYSGGALLGDRVRMQRHAGDAKVFIRSMGARGHLGGLALATREVIRLLGSAGFDWVLVETVGVGQSELEVAAVAGTTVVVLAPGLGDGVQMIKAGILEVADVFVVNKADSSAASRTVKELRQMIDTGPRTAWTPPIVTTVALEAKGVDELLEAIEAHRRHLESTGEAGRREQDRLVDEVADLVAEWARRRARSLLEDDGELAARLRQDRLPYGVFDRIVSTMER